MRKEGKKGLSSEQKRGVSGMVACTAALRLLVGVHVDAHTGRVLIHAKSRPSTLVQACTYPSNAAMYLDRCMPARVEMALQANQDQSRFRCMHALVQQLNVVAK